MPQLDLYIWSMNVMLTFVVFIIIYFFMVFFLVKVARTIYLRHIYAYLINWSNIWIDSFSFFLDNGIITLIINDLLNKKQELLIYYFNSCKIYLFYRSFISYLQIFLDKKFLYKFFYYLNSVIVSYNILEGLRVKLK